MPRYAALTPLRSRLGCANNIAMLTAFNKKCTVNDGSSRCVCRYKNPSTTAKINSGTIAGPWPKCMSEKMSELIAIGKKPGVMPNKLTFETPLSVGSGSIFTVFSTVADISSLGSF